jgi:hypothetical protein
MTLLKLDILSRGDALERRAPDLGVAWAEHCACS